VPDSSCFPADSSGVSSRILFLCASSSRPCRKAEGKAGPLGQGIEVESNVQVDNPAGDRPGTGGHIPFSCDRVKGCAGSPSLEIRKLEAGYQARACGGSGAFLTSFERRRVGHDLLETSGGHGGTHFEELSFFSSLSCLAISGSGLRSRECVDIVEEISVYETFKIRRGGGGCSFEPSRGVSKATKARGSSS